MKKIIVGVFLGACAMFAQAWQPEKPVNLYIGAGPGTTAELAFRIVADDITKRTGVTFAYHHRPGPGQVDVTNNFLDMPKDGHHLLMPFFGDVFVWSELLYKDRVKWTPDSFEYVIGLPSDPAVFVAPKDSPVNSPADLVKYLKSPPKNVNFGTATGTQAIPYHAVMFYGKGDLSKVREIRYKAAREVLMDVASGNLDFGIIPAGLIKTAENTGRVKVIAITAGSPFTNAPSYPLMKSEIKDLVFYIYRLVVLPKGTDPKIVEWFTSNMRKSLENPEIIKTFENNFETINTRYLTPVGIKQTVLEAKRIYQPLAEKSTAPTKKE
jgi:tripartite-type tricarboxylate transporter receptor subunit TctC